MEKALEAAVPETTQPGGGLLDAAKAAGASALTTGAAVAGAVADYGIPGVGPLPIVDQGARVIQDLGNIAAKTVYDSITPANRAAAESSIFPGEGEPSMWTQPARALGMKAAAAAPMIGAGMLTGGTGVIPLLATGAAFGGLNVAESHNAIREQILAAPDTDLQGKSQLYRNLRLTMDEPQAKAQLVQQSRSAVDDLATLATGTLAGVGFMGAGRGVTGLGRRAALGAAKLGPAQGLSSAQGDVSRQRAEARMGLSDGVIDWGKAARAGAQGTVEGGVLGAVMGGYHGWATGRKTGNPTNTPDPALVAGAQGTTAPTNEGPGGVLTPGGEGLSVPSWVGGIKPDIRFGQQRAAQSQAAGYARLAETNPAGLGWQDPLADIRRHVQSIAEEQQRQTMLQPPVMAPEGYIGPERQLPAAPEHDPTIPPTSLEPGAGPSPETLRARRAAVAAARPTVMRTEDGGFYQLFPDGSTRRGNGPRSQMTVYVTPETAEAVRWAATTHADKGIEFTPYEGKLFASFDNGQTMNAGPGNRFTHQPQNGLVPVEFYSDGERGYRAAQVGERIVQLRQPRMGEMGERSKITGNAVQWPTMEGDVRAEPGRVPISFSRARSYEGQAPGPGHNQPSRAALPAGTARTQNLMSERARSSFEEAERAQASKENKGQGKYPVELTRLQRRNLGSKEETRRQLIIAHADRRTGELSEAEQAAEARRREREGTGKSDLSRYDYEQGLPPHERGVTLPAELPPGKAVPVGGPIRMRMQHKVGQPATFRIAREGAPQPHEVKAQQDKAREDRADAARTARSDEVKSDEQEAQKIIDDARERKNPAIVPDWNTLMVGDKNASAETLEKKASAREAVIRAAQDLHARLSKVLGPDSDTPFRERARPTKEMREAREKALAVGEKPPEVADEQPNLVRFQILRTLLKQVEQANDPSLSARAAVDGAFSRYVVRMRALENKRAGKLEDTAAVAAAADARDEAAQRFSKGGHRSMRAEPGESMADQLKRAADAAGIQRSNVERLRDEAARQARSEPNRRAREKLQRDVEGYTALMKGDPVPAGWEPPAHVKDALPEPGSPLNRPTPRGGRPMIPRDIHEEPRPNLQPDEGPNVTPRGEEERAKARETLGDSSKLAQWARDHGVSQDGARRYLREIAEGTEENRKANRDQLKAERAEAEAKAADPNSDTTPEQDADAHYAKSVYGLSPHSTVSAEVPFLKAQMAKLWKRKRGVKNRELGGLLQAMLDKVSERIGTTRVAISHPDDTSTLQRPGFHFTEEGAINKGARGIIVMPHELAVSPDGVQAMTHEIAHAATVHALRDPSKAILRRDLEEIGKQVQKLLQSKPELAREFGITDLEMAQVVNYHNPEEFIANALSVGSGGLQKLLLTLGTPRAIANRMGLGRSTSVWDAMITRVARAFKLTKAEKNMLDAVLRASDELTAYDPPKIRMGWSTLFGDVVRGNAARKQSVPFTERLKEEARAALPHVLASQNWLRQHVPKIATTEGIARMARSVFRPLDGRGTTVADAAIEGLGKMHGTSKRIVEEEATPVHAEAAKLERRFTGSGKWSDYTQLAHDETMMQVFAHKPIEEQTHLVQRYERDADGKLKRDAADKPISLGIDRDAPANWQPIGQHPRLAEAWAALPKELQDFHLKTLRPFLERLHDRAAEGLVRNNVDELVPEKDAAERARLVKGLLDGSVSDEDIKGDHEAAFKSLKTNAALKKLAVYSPLYRQGDYVVHGRYEIDTPRGAERITPGGEPDADGSTFRFNDAAQARAFVESVPHKVLRVRTVYTDPDGVPATKADFEKHNAYRHYDVDVQLRHVEFHDSWVHANQARAALDGKNGLKLYPPEQRRWEPSEISSAFLSREWERAIKRMKGSTSFQRKDAATQHYLERMMVEEALRSMGPTRIQSNRLPRAYVEGASQDLVHHIGRYGLNYAGYISRLEHMPAVDEAMSAMNRERTDRRDDKPQFVQARAALHDELQRRIYDPASAHRDSLFWNVGSRLLQLSFLDKLASPMFHVINSMEPYTIAVPTIGGRHGIGSTIQAMNQAYRDIGGPRDTWAQGWRDTWKAWKEDGRLTDFEKTYKDRLAGAADGERINDVLDDAVARNLIGPDAGMELQSRLQRSESRLMRGFDRSDHMARQMGGAIESMNRTVTGITAYRLEHARQLREGASAKTAHENAKQYALDRIYDTMGDYSAWNSPRVFNSGWGRLAFQFKKYGLKMYQLMMMQTAQALRGDKEALKSLATLLGTHALLAGTLGLPLEPIKAIAVLTGMFTGEDEYQKMETGWRKFLVDSIGPDLGTIAARGLPRYLGVDMQRVGLDNLMLPMGTPKSNSPSDLSAYFAQATLGAPFAMALEWPGAVQKLANGDIMGGSAQLVPLKAYADAMTAVQRLMQGKLTPGNKQAMDPYSVGEAFTRLMGATPGREAETNEMRSAIQGEKAQRTKTRRQFIADWTLASPSERNDLWQQIERSNAGLPPAAQLTRPMLQAAVERRAKDQRTGREQWGITFGRDTQDLRGESRYYRWER